MKTYKIAVIGGDGIGPEVIKEGRKVIEAVADSFSIEWVEFPHGGEHYLKTKELMPDSTLEELSHHDAIFLGAIGHPDVRPGLLEKEILLKTRFHFDQFVNLRPIELFENVPCPLKDKGPEHVNFTVVRENTEDFYIGIGGRTKRGTKDEIAFQTGIATWKGCERVIRYAFELAKRQGKNKLTLVDKANVLDSIYGLWREVFEQVGQDYPGIGRELNFVDACTQWMVRKPESYQVIVTPNMFGDIITDLGAAIQGGMGFAAGGNINPKGLSMFEPIHGSAPKYKGQNRINPIAAIMAGEMMLNHLGEVKSAARIKEAVKKVLREGKIVTHDMGGSSKTTEVGDAVAKAV